MIFINEFNNEGRIGEHLKILIRIKNNEYVIEIYKI